MTEHKLPVSVALALSDIDWFTQNPPMDDSRAMDLLRASQALKAALQRVQELSAPRIGADFFLSAHGYDSIAFYQGVSFALSRVRSAIDTCEDAGD